MLPRLLALTLLLMAAANASADKPLPGQNDAAKLRKRIDHERISREHWKRVGEGLLFRWYVGRLDTFADRYREWESKMDSKDSYVVYSKAEPGNKAALGIIGYFLAGGWGALGGVAIGQGGKPERAVVYERAHEEPAIDQGEPEPPHIKRWLLDVPFEKELQGLGYLFEHHVRTKTPISDEERAKLEKIAQGHENEDVRGVARKVLGTNYQTTGFQIKYDDENLNETNLAALERAHFYHLKFRIPLGGKERETLARVVENEYDQLKGQAQAMLAMDYSGKPGKAELLPVQIDEDDIWSEIINKLNAIHTNRQILRRPLTDAEKRQITLAAYHHKDKRVKAMARTVLEAEYQIEVPLELPTGDQVIWHEITGVMERVHKNRRKRKIPLTEKETAILRRYYWDDNKWVRETARMMLSTDYTAY